MEDGVDYGQNNIHEINDVPTAAKCCYLCTRTSSCKLFSWAKDVKTCWLKHTQGVTTNDVNVVSGAPSNNTLVVG